MKPAVFYKYTSASSALAILRNKTLQWSSPLRFNDPLELQRLPSYNPDLNESFRPFLITLVRVAEGSEVVDESRLVKLNQELLAHFRAAIASGKTVDQIIQALPSDLGMSEADIRQRLLKPFDLQKARILCMTETANNNAMWWHYAEQGSGCVLGFRSVIDSPWIEARKINYFDEIPDLGSGVDAHLYGHTQQTLEMTMDTVCYSKKTEWAYEKEWRLVLLNKKGEKGQISQFAFVPDELESITFGANAEPEVEDEIRALAEDINPSCSFHRIKVHHGESLRIPIEDKHLSEKQ